ncbi:MAG TPA: Flp pilus assembly protein CpaB [Pirellulales bacterium]|jgi:pilus assembly protein CpaB|nr:Flp pilus assembly protein CpaB [Pirellulales bacterium]
MRSKSMLLLMVALGCGLVASIGINQMLAARNVAPVATGESVSVFIAKQPINLGDIIKSEMVRMEEFPIDKTPPEAVTNIDELKGRRARQKILPGMPIVDGWLLGKGENGEDVSTLVPKGYRIVPVRVDAVSGVAGLIKPGDRVDVLVHLRENASMGIIKTTAQTFLQNVKVFAVDDVFRREADGEQSVAAKTISLVVTPAQAELVTLASEMGTVRLVMRSSDDEAVAETSGATARQLFGTSEDAPAAEAPSTSGLGLLGLLDDQRSQPESVQAPKDQWKMVLFEGATPRTIDFEDGVPRDMAGGGAMPMSDGAMPPPDPPTGTSP